MKFHYEFDIKKLPVPITHADPLFLIGSCFTENIGEKLRKYKFRTTENPHGILFNPVSVCESIISYIGNERVEASSLFPLHEGFHSWKHHSRFSGLDAASATEKINTSISRAHAALKDASVIMITLGSAWVYSLTSEAIGGRAGTIVANNHKAPSGWFSRRLLAVEEVLAGMDEMLHRLFAFNSDIQVIFTISPVRHLREGVVENNRSKAVLIQAVHHLASKFDKVYYFPSYELVIDDLRDYRFYSEDMVHPNYAATEYVWEKFKTACMSAATLQLLEKIHPLLLAVKHKPFNNESVQHQDFRKKSLQQARELQQSFPHVDLSAEIEFLTNHQ